MQKIRPLKSQAPRLQTPRAWNGLIELLVANLNLKEMVRENIPTLKLLFSRDLLLMNSFKSFRDDNSNFINSHKLLQKMNLF
jgi:hypothetical protein